MKTSFTTKTIGIFALFLSLLGMSDAASAQCPVVNNNTLCDIEITYVFYSSPGTPCGPMSAAITIPAGGNFAIPCSCTPFYGFDVVLVSQGGTAVSPFQIVSSPNVLTTSYNPTAGCTASPSMTITTAPSFVVDIN